MEDLNLAIKKVREQRRRCLRYLWIRCPFERLQWQPIAPLQYWDDPPIQRIRMAIAATFAGTDVFYCYKQYKDMEIALTSFLTDEEEAIRNNGRTTPDRVWAILRKKVKVIVEEIMEEMEYALGVTEYSNQGDGKDEMPNEYYQHDVTVQQNDHRDRQMETLLDQAKDQVEAEEEEADTTDGNEEEYRGDNYKD